MKNLREVFLSAFRERKPDSQAEAVVSKVPAVKDESKQKSKFDSAPSSFKEAVFKQKELSEKIGVRKADGTGPFKDGTGPRSKTGECDKING